MPLTNFNLRNGKSRFLVLPALILVLATNGCGGQQEAEPSLSVGQKLYMTDGSEFGTIVQLEDTHQFPNGAVEPGALIDYSPRIPGTPPQWLPQRSAEKMAQ